MLGLLFIGVVLLFPKGLIHIWHYLVGKAGKRTPTVQ